MKNEQRTEEKWVGDVPVDEDCYYHDELHHRRDINEDGRCHQGRIKQIKTQIRSMKFKLSRHESENTRCREDGWLIRDLNMFKYILFDDT